MTRQELLSKLVAEKATTGIMRAARLKACGNLELQCQTEQAADLVYEAARAGAALMFQTLELADAPRRPAEASMN